MNKRLCNILDNDSKIALNDLEKPRNSENPAKYSKTKHNKHILKNMQKSRRGVENTWQCIGISRNA